MRSMTGRRASRDAVVGTGSSVPGDGGRNEGVILTRAELQRRTRERSRLAALKLAEASNKVGVSWRRFCGLRVFRWWR